MVRQIFRLFVKDCSIKIAGAMQYRKNFTASVITSLLYSLIYPLFQLMIFTKTKGFQGWTIEQVMFFQAVFMLVTGLMQTLFSNVIIFISMLVVQGNFDRIMLLPYPPLLSLFTRGFSYYALGSVLAGSIGTVYFAIKMQIHISVFNIFLGVVLITIGLVFYLSILIFYCALVLRWTNFSRMRDILEKMFFFTSLPAEVFSGTSKFIYLFVFPIAIWTYFPVQALLGRIDAYVFPSIMVCFLFFAVSILVWNYNLKKYTSAGG